VSAVIPRFPFTIRLMRFAGTRIACASPLMPFEVKIPNPTTVEAMRAADRGKGKRSRSAGALFKELGT
jgi:antitoxin component of RelBE/YafQ-DinJ toxin-antitoxin module